MAGQPIATTHILVPAGALGSGVRADEVEAGLALSPHAIALDAGSTDSGPAYLATGRSKYSRQSVRRDLEILMAARHSAGIPLLIGSCGTSGCDAAVDWTLEIVLELAAAQGTSPKIAVLYAEQERATIAAKLAAGQVKPLAPMGALEAGTLEACDHIVALLGPEPYVAALEAGADIVLGGRTTDTAVLAAMALWRGADPGAAWHAAKIAECGGLCTETPTAPGVMMSVDGEGFTMAPLAAENRCTPYTVSAHMLYENSDPFRLVEPGGVLDVSQARYAALDARTVRVTGSRWTPAPYTMKLEGAGGGPFQTIMLVGIEDPAVMADLDSFLGRMSHALRQRVARTLGPAADSVGISLRPYGWNAVSGRPARGRPTARDRPAVRGHRSDPGPGDRGGQGLQPLLLPLPGAGGKGAAQLRLPLLAGRDRARPGVRISPQPRRRGREPLRAGAHADDRAKGDFTCLG